MILGGAVLVMSAASLVIPGMPVGTAVAMALAALFGMRAAYLHAASAVVAGGGGDAATPVLRAARFCDDAALALCVLAALFALGSL
jgi:hypothetical protein